MSRWWWEKDADRLAPTTTEPSTSQPADEPPAEDEDEPNGGRGTGSET